MLQSQPVGFITRLEGKYQTCTHTIQVSHGKFVVYFNIEIQSCSSIILLKQIRSDILSYLILGIYVLNGKVGNQGRRILVYISWLLHSRLSGTFGARRRLFFLQSAQILTKQEDFEIQHWIDKRSPDWETSLKSSFQGGKKTQTFPKDPQKTHIKIAG